MDHAFVVSLHETQAHEEARGAELCSVPMAAEAKEKSGFTEANTAETVRDLDSLAVWLQSNKIRNAGTRLETYRTHLHGFLEAERQGRTLEFSREIGRDHLYNSMFEAHEWCSIYRAFGGEKPDKELRSALQKAVGGPEFHDEEEATRTTARDTQLELSFGALLKHAGLPVAFGGGGDLWFPLREWRVFVECKRVQTTKKIVPRVSHAHEQLESRYKADPDPRLCRGLVALSVTKPANPEPRRRPTYPTWSALRASLRARAQQILKVYENDWSARWRSSGTPWHATLPSAGHPTP